jgi:hypothetical protein
MKQGFAVIAGLLVLGVLIGARWAGAAPGVGASASGAPSDFVFAAPKNASNLGNTKPAVLGASSDGTVHAPFAGTDNTRIIDSYNTTFGGDFANTTLDSSPDIVGSERMVSDSHGRLNLAWYHNLSADTTVIYYGRHDPGAGGTWAITTIPGSTTSPGYKVMGIARGQNVGAYDRIWVLWARNGSGAQVAYTDDGGASWSPVDTVPGPFSGTAADFNVGATTGGQVFVGWFDRETTDIQVQMKPSGGAWGPITDVSHRAVKGQDYTPRFATAPDGGLRLVWTGIANPAVPEADAFYREWAPSGWSPTIVQLFSTAGGMNSSGLEIVTDSTGVNHIVWDDDTGRAQNNVATYYIRGRPGSFTAPQAVVPQFGGATSRYPYVDVGPVPGSTAKVHVVTNSNVAGTFDNYYTWTEADLVPPSPTPVRATPTPCTPSSFSDVPPTNPFYPFVHDLSLRGAISGYGDCTFRPNANITRGQIAKVIMIADGYTLISPPSATFADVPAGSAFYTFVETAAAQGIISGYSCGGPGETCDAQHRPYFRPNANVTRGQLSKMVVLAKQWTVLNPAAADFADVTTASPFYTVVETAYIHGIISGYACGGPGETCDAGHRPYFRQYSTATRGQASKIIDLAISSGDITPTATP